MEDGAETVTSLAHWCWQLAGSSTRTVSCRPHLISMEASPWGHEGFCKAWWLVSMSVLKETPAIKVSQKPKQKLQSIFMTKPQKF